MNKNEQQQDKEENETTQDDSAEYNKLAEENDKSHTRKPGSQSNNADTHNNGRGGGK